MRQRLGQHFLHDEAALTKIAAAVGAQQGETIIEIGPGHGELTKQLVAHYPQAVIMAIEKDSELAADLATHIKGPSIIEGDVRVLLATVTKKLAKEHAVFRIVGNIPYYLTGHLLRMIGELEILPESVVLLVQKEVAERIAAQPPDMNRLAASVQYWATPEILGNVKREQFDPPPEVDSAILRLAKKEHDEKRGKAHRDQYYACVRALFSQPRKTIVNNLTGAHKKDEEMKQKIHAALDKAAIDPSMRPQDLGIEEITKLSPLFSQDNSV